MEFQFKPGDFVCMATDEGNFPPPKYKVLERITQECPGGIQRHYNLRRFQVQGAKMETAEFRVLDHEVMPVPSEAEMLAAYETEMQLAEKIQAIRKKHQVSKWD